MALFLCSASAFAEDAATDKLSDAIDEIIDGLDLKEIENAYSDIEFFSDLDARETIRSYVGGQTDFSIEDLFGLMIRLIFGSVSGYVPEVLSVLAVAIFGCVLDSIKLSNDQSVNELGFFFINALIITLVSSLFFSVFNVAKNCVDIMTNEIQAVFPILLTLMTASGASATATAFQPSVSYVCTFESVIAEKISFPIVVMLYLFGVIGCLSKSIKAGRMNDFFKSAFKWITGATGVVFAFFITVQSVAASTFDGFSLKALKYVVGGSVPIISQFVGGGFDIVFASCVLVKNSLGVLALVALLVTVLSPIIKIVVLSLFLRFLAAVTEPVSDERIVKFIGLSADSLNYVAAIVISVAVVYFITVFVAICSLGVAV